VADKQGQPAFQFFLKDNAGTLKVISRDSRQEGDQVIVEARLPAAARGRIAVYNEVTAIFIRPLNQFEADLIGYAFLLLGPFLVLSPPLPYESE
jgi:hypothetical protein